MNWLGHSAADFATAEQGGKADSLSATWTNYSPASFITPPGDANVDASVQRTLERVKFVAPFPEGATEKERTYIINFNPKTKQTLE